MTRARDIANLVDANGDIVAGALDNVPAADMVNDTTPQLGGHLDTNDKRIEFADSVYITGSPSLYTNRAQFGTGKDLEIYGDSYGGAIRTGAITNLIHLDSGYFRINNGIFGSGYKEAAKFDAYAECSLRYDGSQQLVTTANGVSMPNQVAFSVTPSGGNYITTSPIQFDTVNFNIGNAFNASNYTFTAPIAGRYLFHLHLGIVRLNSSGASGYPRFQVNGNNQNYAYVSGPSGLYVNANMTMVRVLSANDTVKVVYQGSNSNYYDGANECIFMGYLLG